METLKNDFRKSHRSTAIPPLLKVCAALRFFAEGSFQKSHGNDFNLGMAQPTLSVVLTEVVHLIEQKLCKIWIISKLTEEEKAQNKNYFYSKTKFPGIVGCIDGTHVHIMGPKEDVRRLYLNRKGYFSLNVLLVSYLCITNNCFHIGGLFCRCAITKCGSGMLTVDILVLHTMPLYGIAAH